MEVSVQEAKAHFSWLLRRVEAGESVTIRRGQQPVAVLVRAPVAPGKRQIWGGLKGSMSPDFDEPLDEFKPHS
ncbi:MAG: type II toxin-antitoxin system prevent-host-death family antitoxin [Solirubrobacterales bacterium]|nr:type II toxin-antitoxin system prevent-host-death family antitoxin [Solirubrobacterales bacterium]